MRRKPPESDARGILAVSLHGVGVMAGGVVGDGKLRIAVGRLEPLGWRTARKVSVAGAAIAAYKSPCPLERIC